MNEIKLSIEKRSDYFAVNIGGYIFNLKFADLKPNMRDYIESEIKKTDLFIDQKIDLVNNAILCFIIGASEIADASLALKASRALEALKDRIHKEKCDLNKMVYDRFKKMFDELKRHIEVEIEGYNFYNAISQDKEVKYEEDKKACIDARIATMISHAL